MRFFSALVPFVAFIFAVFLCFSDASAQTAIQLRVLGGPLVDEGNSILPLTNGTYVVGHTSSQGGGTVRGYVVWYDANFQFGWSLLTPYGSPVEQAIDAWLDGGEVGAEDLLVMTRRLGANGTFNVNIHSVKNLGTSGEVVSSTEIVHDLNQFPVAAVNWRGSRYAVGTSEGDGWLLNIDDPLSLDNASFTTWGHPVRTENVESATVYGDTLYVSGSTEINGIEQSTVWAWGPDGAPLWARISPDPDAFGNNVANDIAIGPDGMMLLYSYERPELPIGHGVISLNPSNGTPGIGINTAGDIMVEGKKMVWADNQLLKLAHIDLAASTGTDMVLTHLGTYGGYMASGVLGTTFNEYPNDLKVDDLGQIWILGTTHGFLNGSSSICIYRIDSIDVIPSISSITAGLGLLNDPLFFNSIGIEDIASSSDFSIYPNPAHRNSTPVISNVSTDYISSQIYWSVFSSTSGKLCSTGESYHLDVSSLTSGSYIVHIKSNGTVARLPLQLID